MLKLVSPGTGVDRQEPERCDAANVGVLLQQVDDERASGDATQRAVARGRRTLVEGHCLVRSIEADSAEASANARRSRPSECAALVRRLEEIHVRLLSLSGAVEMEMDRLDIASAEIQRLSADLKDGQ